MVESISCFDLDLLPSCFPLPRPMPRISKLTPAMLFMSRPACAVALVPSTLKLGDRGRSNNDIIFETPLGITLLCAKQPRDTYIGKIGLLSAAAHHITMPIVDALANTKRVRVHCCALWCHDAEELINTQVLLK